MTAICDELFPEFTRRVGVGRELYDEAFSGVGSLVIEQKQLIRELDLIGQHLAELEAEMIQIVGNCREGKILTSLPGVGPLAAATLIAFIGTIANFERASQRKAHIWAGSQK